MKAFIVGSGFSEMEGFVRELVNTKHGEVEVLKGDIEGEAVVILPRRKEGRDFLPHHINFLGNLLALKQLQADCIISLSTAGIFDPRIPLATSIIPSDIFFPENRLPDGSPCTVFQSREDNPGHLITASLFNSAVHADISLVLPEALADTLYIHANGPRFNTQIEIEFFKKMGGTVISQTCGPEVVLANELEIPYGQLLFTVNYVNGVETSPVSEEEYQANLGKSKEVFEKVIKGFSALKKQYTFEGKVHRFE